MKPKLYCFHGGSLVCDKNAITLGRGVGTPYEVPIPYFLIDHPKGKALYDTGMAMGVALDKRKHWGKVCDVYDPKMTQDQFVVNNLAKIGVKPEDISFVIQSHLHLDHAGGLGCFPNAKYVVQQDELRWAYAPQWFQAAAYIKEDLFKPINWLVLRGALDDNYDLFGDGTVRIWFSPGHTPGHQNVAVETEHNGTIVLTGDSCYNTEILDEDVMPGLVWNCEATVNSIARMRHAKNMCGYKIITGHDPESWVNVRKAPEFYD